MSNPRRFSTASLLCAFGVLVSIAAVVNVSPAAEIERVAASSSQSGNGPEHALDGNLRTRWSSEGKGQWLQVDLSEPVALSSSEVGFQRGNRRYAFEVRTSVDGKDWKTVFKGASDGSGDRAQSFSLEPTTAKFVRFVNQGNNENLWVNLHTFKLPGVTVSKKLARPKPPPKKAGDLELTLWAENPVVASPVGISFDNKGRAYATRVRRRKISSLDLRNHRSWVKHDLSIRSLEDKLAFYKKAMGPQPFPGIRHFAPPDRNEDGVRDWRDLAVQKEEIVRIEDVDGDGAADKRVLLDDDLGTPLTGIAAGVLWSEGDLYAAVEPDVWRYRDIDGDGHHEARSLISRGYSIHVGQGGHNVSGLTMGPDGRLYWSVADKGIHATGKDGERHFYPDRGGVMRCEPDGSRLEVFAYGVRNGQELAFDEFGNLFTVDNDGDYPGERERFLYLAEAGMTAWRLHWQWHGHQDYARVSGEPSYNVWMKEGYFRTRFPGQAAFIVPPLANYSNGPCGFAYDPGTALNDNYRNCFFLAQGRRLSAFRVRPKGAAFEMYDERTLNDGIHNTGLAFGPGGALYVADWMNGPSERGRIWKLDDPAAATSSARKRTRELLAAGPVKLSFVELVASLAEPDVRVRKAAQFEFVRRGDKGLEALVAVATRSQSRLARLHAIWGLGQFARGWPGYGKPNPAAVLPLRELLDDSDLETRSQAAKVLGESRDAASAPLLLARLRDDSPRVRYHSALALGKLENPAAVKPLFALLRENADKDSFLRHAAVMGLVGSTKADPAPLLAAAKSPDLSIRLAAVLALRRHAHAGIAAFLKDEDGYLLTEVARAIHDDFSIPEALPALAEILDRPNLSGEPLLRRVINANFRVGRPEDATRLARYAARKDAPQNMRTTALAGLALWPQPPVLDAVEGRFRKHAPRDPGIAAKALSAVAEELVADAPAKVMTVFARAVERLKVVELLPAVRAAYGSENATPFLRAQLLDAMAELSDPELGRYVKAALDAKDARLRQAAQRYARFAGLDPLEVFRKALAEGTLFEKRSALALLARSEDPAADRLLAAQFTGLDPALELDLLEAARSAQGSAAKEKAAARDAALVARGKLGPHLPVLNGGDPTAGQTIALGHPAAQCIRCHSIKGSGGILGPDLSEIATRLTPEQLLESLVDPQATLAEGYGLLVATLKDGSTLTGSITKVTPIAYQLQTPDGKTVEMPRALIASETKTSPMPSAAASLSPQELRHLLAYLFTLR